MMKKYYKVIWMIFLIQLAVIAIVITTAKVDDMTLAKGKVQSFNEGWVLVREDGSQKELQSLPHNDTSRSGEKITIKNSIKIISCQGQKRNVYKKFTISVSC